MAECTISSNGDREVSFPHADSYVSLISAEVGSLDVIKEVDFFRRRCKNRTLLPVTRTFWTWATRNSGAKTFPDVSLFRTYLSCQRSFSQFSFIAPSSPRAASSLHSMKKFS